jgi:ATP synthase I chain
MPQIDQAFYERVVRRIRGMILALGATGTIVLAIWQGPRAGGGFLIGTAASYLSFWRWQHVVESMGPGKRRSPWLLTLRMALIIAVGYVIIKITGANPAAAVVGLLLPGAAVTCEIIYELIHGT